MVLNIRYFIEAFCAFTVREFDTECIKKKFIRVRFIQQFYSHLISNISQRFIYKGNVERKIRNEFFAAALKINFTQ